MHLNKNFLEHGSKSYTSQQSEMTISPKKTKKGHHHKKESTDGYSVNEISEFH